MPNQRYETELYQEQIAEIRKGDRKAAEQIEAIVGRVIANPHINDGSLKGNRARSFKKKAVDRKYRITFRYCQWCLKVPKERCGDCAAREEQSVIIEDVFLRRDGYD